MHSKSRHTVHVRLDDEGTPSNVAAFARGLDLRPHFRDRPTAECFADCHGGVVTGPVERPVVDRRGVLPLVAQGALGRALGRGSLRPLRPIDRGEVRPAAAPGVGLAIPDGLGDPAHDRPGGAA